MLEKTISSNQFNHHLVHCLSINSRSMKKKRENFVDIILIKLRRPNWFCSRKEEEEGDVVIDLSLVVQTFDL